MPHYGSRTATSVECMPAGWPRPAPNTLEVLYREIECIGTEGHGPALFKSLKRHYFANKTPIGKKTATFTRQPPTLSSLANDVGGQPLARCHTRKNASQKQRLQYTHTHTRKHAHKRKTVILIRYSLGIRIENAAHTRTHIQINDFYWQAHGEPTAMDRLVLRNRGCKAQVRKRRRRLHATT